MLFLHSLKLFGSNFVKALKFFLFYLVIWGICFALLLPVLFEFKGILSDGFKLISDSLTGVFSGSFGERLFVLIGVAQSIVVSTWHLNVGLFVYGILVLFVLLPFLVNVGKYTFCEMLYSYMTSKNKIGFFSALFKGMRKSLLFALCKVFYNLVFMFVLLFACWGVGKIENEFFVKYFLPIVEFVIPVLLLSVEQLTVLGWMPALIVFDCNVFVAYQKGLKAVMRHLLASFGTTVLYFFLFWLCVMVFGFYTLLVLVPILTILLCVFNMVTFFSSQGMRFYVDKTNILTPKKLEEVDNINKTAFLL